MSESFDAVDLQSSIHTDRSERLSMVSETNAHSKSRVIVERLQGFPLFAKVDTDVGTSNGQISAALVEAQILDFVAFV